MSAVRRILQIVLPVYLLVVTSLVATSEEQAALSVIPPGNSSDSECIPAPTSEIAAGYWIVRSHASPQEFGDSAPAFCPVVTRFDQCVGFRQSTIHELTDTLIPGIPVCVFCHGSFVSWQDVMTESCETWKWLHHACPNQPIQMVYFSWPSDRPVISPIIQLDVNRLGRRAGRNGFYMASLIQQIPSDCPVCLVGHSHGTRVVASSLHLMGGGAVEDYTLSPGPYPKHRLRAVFAASAIDHNWMNPGYHYDRALCSVECILNLKNSCDPALLIYPLRHPFSGGAMGFKGVTRRDRRKIGPSNPKIQELDLSEEIGIGHHWPDYYQRPWLAIAMRNYLVFADNGSQN